MKILVYGWYGSGNIGDELFCEAFNNLFPTHQFIYTKVITKDNLNNIDAVFFGGGSFLDGEPKIKPDALEILKQKKIFYIGIGIETNIHPIHQELMKLARLIAARSTINNYYKFIPDLVYSLKGKETKHQETNKSILVIPNIELTAKWSDSNWKNLSWEYFKLQFSQFLDEKVENGYSLDFMIMCSNDTMRDDWAAIEIINKMKNRKSKYRLFNPDSKFESVTKLMSQYSVIISQRFHGIVLAEILNKPYIAIHHHDKIKNCYPNRGNFISYYEISKDKLSQNFFSLNELKNDLNMDFNELKKEIESLLIE